MGGDGSRLVEVLADVAVAVVGGIINGCLGIRDLGFNTLARRPVTREDWLENACQLLSGGADAPDISAIAATVGMSHERFRKVFKSAAGESPSTYRRRRRLVQASLMLHRSDLKLDMIAESLGFCDGFHLSKAFKAEYGHSPSIARGQKECHAMDV